MGSASEFRSLGSALLRAGLSAVSPRAFYADLFGPSALERVGHPEDALPNMMLTVIRKGDAERERSFHAILFDGFVDSRGWSLEMYCDRYPFIVTSPVLYSGKRKSRGNAYLMYGMCIDLDYVYPDNARDLIHQMRSEQLPEATYLVQSGSGLHVYYMFDDPVEMYPYRYEALTALKRELTEVVWNSYTSASKSKQFQGIIQGFRVVGSRTKFSNEQDDVRVTAYKLGGKCYVEDLFSWVLKNRSLSKAQYVKMKHIYDGFTINSLTVDDAKTLYPEWYQRRIVEKKPMVGYKSRRTVYDWWLNRVERDTYDGNRYYSVCVLYAYAIKCGIPIEEVRADALRLQPILDSKTKNADNHFTVDDVMDAEKFYHKQYKKLSISTIENMTRLSIDRNKRNGRKQAVHVQVMSSVRDVLYPDGSWRNTSGAPKKQQIVADWRAVHPDGTKAQCRRETGLSKPTVYKWWDA